MVPTDGNGATAEAPATTEAAPPPAATETAPPVGGTGPAQPDRYHTPEPVVPPETIYARAFNYSNERDPSIIAAAGTTQHACAGTDVAVWEYKRVRRLEVRAPISVTE